MNLSSLAGVDIARVELTTASGTNGPTYTAAVWNNIVFTSTPTVTNNIVSNSSGLLTVQPGKYLVNVQFAPGQLTGTGSSIYISVRLRNSANTATILKWPQGFIAQSGTYTDHGKLIGNLYLTTATAMRLQMFPTATRTHQPTVADGESNLWWAIDFTRYA